MIKSIGNQVKTTSYCFIGCTTFAMFFYDKNYRVVYAATNRSLGLGSWWR